MAGTTTRAKGTSVAAIAVTTPSSRMRWTIGRSDTPGPGSPPMDPNGARRDPLSRWFIIQGARPYMTSPVHRPWAMALKPTGTQA